MADPDLQINRGGGGRGEEGGYSDPEIRGPNLKKELFSALRASV